MFEEQWLVSWRWTELSRATACLLCYKRVSYFPDFIQKCLIVVPVAAIWLSHALFEPLRNVHFIRNDAFRNYVIGEEYRQIMTLVANSVYEETRSAEFPAGSSSFLMVKLSYGGG